MLLIMLMYIVINNKLRQKISILALLKQFKFKINLSRNNLEHLLWLNFERQKEVNIKGICSFVTDFGNFKGEKWSNIVEYSRHKTFLAVMKEKNEICKFLLSTLPQSQKNPFARYVGTPLSLALERNNFELVDFIKSQFEISLSDETPTQICYL